MAVTNCVVCVATVQGAPSLYYNPDTGNIRLAQDNLYPLAVVDIQSASGSLLAPSQSALPNVPRDIGDLPFFLVFFSVQVGSFDLGQIVVPHTSIEDISFYYATDASITLVGDLGFFRGDVFLAVPEPKALGILMGLVALTLASARRRFAIDDGDHGS